MAGLTARAGSSFGAWSRQSSDDEYLAKLKFPKGSSVYDQMRRSDPQVNAVLQAIASPILAASWVVEPATDGNTQDEAVATFIENNLFPATREDDVNVSYKTSWQQTLRNILLHVPFGYMVIEKVYEAINGSIVVSDLGPRLPKTIKEFRYEKTGNQLEEIIQKVSGRTFIIPAEKAMVFTFNKEGSNAAGISLLRPIYKPWAIKDDLEKIQAIMFERYGVGVPVGTVGANAKPGDQEFDKMEEALENISSNEVGYAVLPSEQTIDILNNGTGTAPDINSAIVYYDNQIAIAWHAMFMMLGSSTSGNRALGDTFMDFFLTTVQSIGDAIADVFNNDLIPELTQLNFNVTNFPRLKMLPIKEIDFEVVSQLKTAGLITATEGTENRLRELVGINELEEGEFNVSDESDNDNDTDVVVEDEIVVEEDMDAHDKHDKGNHRNNKSGVTYARRQFNEAEVEFGLPQMELQLDKKQASVDKQLIKIRDRQGRVISEQIADGKLPSNISVPYKKEMYTELLDTYKEQRQIGWDQSKKNAQRQGVTFATPPTSANELLELTERMLSVQVEGASNKLKSMLLEEAVMLQRQGVTGNALELALVDYMQDQVSEATWHQMAATAVNGGWGDGHISFVSNIADRVDYQVYSAVLDDNTCDVCRGPDGETHAVGSPDHIAPNPGCLGGDRCRCVNITFYKGT